MNLRQKNRIMITSKERGETRPGEVKDKRRRTERQVNTRKQINRAMIVRREARVQTTEGKVRSYCKQHSCVRGSDRIIPRRVMDIEVTNEKEGLQEWVKQLNLTLRRIQLIIS